MGCIVCGRGRWILLGIGVEVLERPGDDAACVDELLKVAEFDSNDPAESVSGQQAFVDESVQGS